MLLTEPVAWENDPAVMQILVFPSQEAKERFEQQLRDAPLTGGGFPDENALGAAFKLRAVKNNRGTWDAVVRCGYTGYLLSEERADHQTPSQAIGAAKELLLDLIVKLLRRSEAAAHADIAQTKKIEKRFYSCCVTIYQGS